MAVYDWPAAFYPIAMEWGNRKAAVQFRSPYNGTPQAVELVAERWLVAITLPPTAIREAGAIEAFFERLAGGLHRVRLHHRARPVPVGTMRGIPTLGASVARGASSLQIATSAGATLAAGDLFEVSGQLFKAAEAATANGSGAMTVPLVHRVRFATASGTSVQWDRPKAQFVMPAMGSRVSYAQIVTGEIPFDLEEVW